MRRIAIVALVALSVACASSQQRPEGPSPCTSAAYEELQGRPIDSLSEREYERLRELERACADYQITREEQKANQSRAGLAKVLGAFLVGALVFSLAMAASI